jgi:nitric oxide reductase subunit B
MSGKISFHFIFLALLALLLGVLLGCVGAFQYLYPGLFKEFLSFERTRPLHVTFVISWIILCVTGVVYFSLANDDEKTENEKKQFSFVLARWHFFLFLLTGIILVILYCLGIFGGREYLEFPPYFIIPILIGWVLFAINFFITSLTKMEHPTWRKEKWPVYKWMWATGIIFMLFTLTEAHLWLLPYFRNNLVRDITVQWKSMGAMIGSWNMLVYGTGIYLLHKIRPDEKTLFGKEPFFLYFIGLINLMFGWAHHTYIVPAAPWIRYIAYFISMTELIVLAKIIADWLSSLTVFQKTNNPISYRFLFAADIWIALNLILAILISIPAINFYTHGTHFTVAHSMGTTIAINTNILLAAVFFILLQRQSDFTKQNFRKVNVGFFIFQFSLLLFWLALMLMGYAKSQWIIETGNTPGITQMQATMHPYILIFLISGIGLLTGLCLVVIPALIGMRKMIGI